jgi:hypothetical protein
VAEVDGILDQIRRRQAARAAGEGAGEGAPAAPAAGEEAPVRAPAPATPAPAPAVAAAPVVEDSAGLAIPSPEDWDVPVHCFRCQGEYAVPFPSYRAGTVFRCPHCLGSFVPTLSMVRAVAEALERFHAGWAGAFERLHEKRRRELEQFEERQRQELARFEGELRTIAMRERAPGAPIKRRSFWSF